MGFLDSLNERIDAAADWTGEKLEEGTEWVGDRTEDGLRWGGDQLTEAGWDGGGEAMHEAADGVANVTGAELDERELGQTEDPKELIRGEPSAIESKSTTLSEMSTSIGNTGEALAAIKVNDWAGDGVDAFNAVYSTQPGLWAEASSAFSTASSAYKTYSGQVKAAQKKAGDAIDEWKKGERYRDRYNALSSEEKSKSTLDTKAKDAFEAAKEILRGARADRDNAVGVASGELDSAAATAPEEPPFLTKMGQNVSDFMSMGDQAMTSFTEGLVTGTTGMVAFVRSVNPTDSYNRTHPAEYMSRMSDMGTGLVQAAADPGAVVDAMWTEFKEDPFKAFGAAVPEALVGLGTGGAGTAAARSANITRKLADIGTPPRGTPDAPTTPRPNPTSTSTPGDDPASRPGGTDPATRPTSSDPSPSPAPDRAGGPEQSSTPEPGPAASPDSGPIEAPVNAGPSDSPAPQATPESSSAPAQSATPEPSEAPHQSTTPEHSGTPAESSPASPQSSPDTGGSTDSTPEPRTAPDSPGHADSPAETSHSDSPAAAESTRGESVPPAATPDSDGIDSTDLNLGDNTPGTSQSTPDSNPTTSHDTTQHNPTPTPDSDASNSEAPRGDSATAAESTRSESVPPAATPDSDGIDSTDLNLGDNTPGTSAGTPEQSAVSPHDAGTDSRPDTGHSTHASESDPGDRPAAGEQSNRTPPASSPDGQQPGQSPAAAPDSADPAHSPASDDPTAGRDQGPGTTGPGEPGSPRTGGPTSATPEQPGDTPKQHDAPASDSTTPAGDNHNGIRPAAVPPVAALAPSPGTAIPSSSAPHGNGPATPGPAATPSTPHNSNPHGSSNQPGSTKDPANRPHATEPDVPEASHAPDAPGPTPTPDPDKSPGPDAKPHHGPEAHPDTNSATPEGNGPRPVPTPDPDNSPGPAAAHQDGTETPRGTENDSSASPHDRDANGVSPHDAPDGDGPFTRDGPMRPDCAHQGLDELRHMYPESRYSDLPPAGDRGIPARELFASLDARPHHMSFDDIAQALRADGPGSSAPITHSWTDNRGGHTLIARNNDGELELFDPATGKAHPWPPDTTNIDEVVAARLDAHGRPIEPLNATVHPLPADRSDPLSPADDIGHVAGRPDPAPPHHDPDHPIDPADPNRPIPDRNADAEGYRQRLDELKQYEFDDPKRTEQYHDYIDRKDAAGKTPRTPESYNEARDYFHALRERGLAFEAEIARRLDLHPPPGHNLDTDGPARTLIDSNGDKWKVRTRQKTDLGPREADLLGPGGERFEMKSGGPTTGKAILTQLAKDETFLEWDKSVTWVVESTPARDILDTMTKLHKKYPNLFSLHNADGYPFNFGAGHFDRGAPKLFS